LAVAPIPDRSGQVVGECGQRGFFALSTRSVRTSTSCPCLPGQRGAEKYWRRAWQLLLTPMIALERRAAFLAIHWTGAGLSLDRAEALTDCLRGRGAITGDELADDADCRPVRRAAVLMSLPCSRLIWRLSSAGFSVAYSACRCVRVALLIAFEASSR
jgi:hypothetical protein